MTSPTRNIWAAWRSPPATPVRRCFRPAIRATISPRSPRRPTEHFSPPTRPTTTDTIKFASIAGCPMADGPPARTFRSAQAKADIWMPQIAVDAQDRLWVIWCEQTGQSADKTGNWDLYARSLVNDTWGPARSADDRSETRYQPSRRRRLRSEISTSSGRRIPITPATSITASSTGRPGRSRWPSPRMPKATGSPASPSIAEGTAWIAFDSYRNGDYDVFLDQRS